MGKGHGQNRGIREDQDPGKGNEIESEGALRHKGRERK